MISRLQGEAGDGHTALTEAARLQPDVVLLDVTMPGLGGLKALIEVRKRLPSAVIIVMTSHEDPVYRSEALSLGADAFVLKLWAPFDLVPAIRDALAGRQRRIFPSSE